MIPKIIHYIWLGDNKKSKMHEKVLRTWKKRAKDYQIVEWNNDNTKEITNTFFKDAMQNHNYAFASDYLRLYILKKYGGIYMDLDMILVDNPDKILKNYDLVFSIQDKNVIFQTSFIAATKNNDFISECLKIYDNLKFNKKGMIPNSELLTPVLLKNYKFKHEDKTQVIDGVCAYNSEILLQPSFKSVAIHIGEKTWKENDYRDKLRIFLRQRLNNKFEAGIFKYIQDIGRRIIKKR